MPRELKKQPAWGYRVARPFREVNRRVTTALKELESDPCGKFLARCKCLKNGEKCLRQSLMRFVPVGPGSDVDYERDGEFGRAGH